MPKGSCRLARIQGARRRSVGLKNKNNKKRTGEATFEALSGGLRIEASQTAQTGSTCV